MREFVSPNGLSMIEGLYFNWQKQNVYSLDGNDPYAKEPTIPWIRNMTFGDMTDMWICNYHTLESETAYDLSQEVYRRCTLTITKMQSTVGGLTFYCETASAAEIICLSAMKGEGYELAPLYRKDDVAEKSMEKVLAIEEAKTIRRKEVSRPK